MSEKEIQIRKAEPTDIETITAFNQAMARETEGKSLDSDVAHRGVEAVFRSPDKGFYLIAEIEGEVVGSLLITYEWSDWRSGNFWWIQSVYVVRKWRRRGVYRALHQFVCETARAREDVCGIRLYVSRDNPIARQTYARLGMTQSHYDMFEIDFVL